MNERSTSRDVPEVKPLRIVLITLLVLYGCVLVSTTLFLATVTPSFSLHPWLEIRVFLDKVLSGAIYFFIAYNIFKLIGLVSRGEPFSPGSPLYIRRIAYSVLGLGLITAIVSMIFELTQTGARLAEAIIRVLYGGLGTALLGFGFLVIARVLEVGVRLKQDQDLTV